MTCSDYTTNNRPLGAGYDSRGNPRSLSELANISVSSVSATVGLYLNNITPLTGTTVTINGNLVATGGVSVGDAYFSALADVSPTSVYTPGFHVVVNDVGELTTEEQPAAGVALSGLSDVSIAAVSVSNILQHNGSVWVNAVSPYALTTTVTALNATVTGHIADSSIHFTSGSLSSYYAASSWVNSTFATQASLASHTSDATIHFTSGSLSGYYAASSWVNSNYASQASLTSHTSDSTIHFTSAALVPHFVAASGGTYNSNYSFGSVSASTFSATNYSGVSLSASLRDVSITSPSNGQALIWNNSTQKWTNTTLSTTSLSDFTTFTGTTLPATYQAKDDTLTALAGLTTAADRIPYFTNTDTATTAVFSQYARTFVSAADVSAARGTIGLSGPANSFVYFSAANVPASSPITSQARNYLGRTYSNDSFLYTAGGLVEAITPGPGAIVTTDGTGQPATLSGSIINDTVYFDGGRWSVFGAGAGGSVLLIDTDDTLTWAQGGTSKVLATDSDGIIGWVASSTFAGAGGSPGGSNTQIQFNNTGAFAGDSALTWDLDLNILSATNIRFNAASGAVVSATTVSAGTLHVGGSDGYVKNNNGNIYFSAINGQLLFPNGLSGLSATLTTINGTTGNITTVNATTLTATTVSATTYSNLPNGAIRYQALTVVGFGGL